MPRYIRDKFAQRLTYIGWFVDERITMLQRAGGKYGSTGPAIYRSACVAERIPTRRNQVGSVRNMLCQGQLAGPFRFARRMTALALAAFASTVAAGQLPPQFTLSRYVPDDAWFVVHAAHNPQREWLDQRWAAVWSDIQAKGVDKDVLSLVLSLVGEQDRPKIESAIEKASRLMQGVRWGDLAHDEFVFAERLAACQLGNDYILMTRGLPGTVEANFDGLAAILEELASIACCGKVVPTERDGVHLRSLQFDQKGLKELGFCLVLFRKDNVVGLASSAQAADDVIGLLSGKSAAKSIAVHPRFLEALSHVAPPADELSFFDNKRFIADMDRMFVRLAAKVEEEVQKKRSGPEPASALAERPKTGKDEHAVAHLKGLRQVIRLVDVFDYSITSSSMSDRRMTSTNYSCFQAGKEDSPVAAMILKRAAFDRFDQYVPKEATGFQLDSLIDLELAYKTLDSLVSSDLPDGKATMDDVRNKLALLGLDLQRDLFDWWSGEMIRVSLPPSVVTPFGGGDGVIMFRVKNPELAAQKVNSLIEFAGNALKEHGQTLMVTPASVDGGAFREVTLPPLAMIARPVVGIHENWLVLGTSSTAVGKCLQTAAGKHPSVADNPRFREEGLRPDGPVLSVSFTDTSKWGQESAAVATAVGMFGGMALAGLPDGSPEAAKWKGAAQRVLGIVTKLGQIVQKIDFYSSEAAATTFDGKRSLTKRMIVTYKPNTDLPTLTEKHRPK